MTAAPTTTGKQLSQGDALGFPRLALRAKQVLAPGTAGHGLASDAKTGWVSDYAAAERAPVADWQNSATAATTVRRSASVNSG